MRTGWKLGAWVLIGLLSLVSVAAVGLMVFVVPSDTSVSTLGGGSLANLTFVDVAGAPQTVASFNGQATLINVWATWCAPCREEMPDLDRLQAELGNDKFQVVTLSIDRTGNEAVRPFFEDVGVRNPAVYLDPTMSVMASAGIVGLPTTILVDANGEEVYRWVGPRHWGGPEARSAIALYLENGSVAQLDLPSPE